jgi:hypothetical protein
MMFMMMIPMMIWKRFQMKVQRMMIFNCFRIQY